MTSATFGINNLRFRYRDTELQVTRLHKDSGTFRLLLRYRQKNRYRPQQQKKQKTRKAFGTGNSTQDISLITLNFFFIFFLGGVLLSKVGIGTGTDIGTDTGTRTY
jgi:hypothetical protein